MDIDAATAPLPTARSAVHVPRPGAVPTPSPRTITATRPSTAARSATRAIPTSQQNELPRFRCPLCCRPHRLPHCGIFKGMPPQQRQQVARAHLHCLSCLSPTHTTQECTSGYVCQMCMLPHLTVPRPGDTLPHATAGAKDVKNDSNREGQQPLRTTCVRDITTT